MAGSYNTEALISAVRMRGFLPATDDGVNFPRDADIVTMANQEMDSFLVPWLIECREGHLNTTLSQQLQAQVAAYTIPSRAVGSTLALVQLTDTQGNAIYPGLVERDAEIALQYPANQAVFGQPTSYYWQGNQLILVPAPADSTLFLRWLFPQRPNQLVVSTAVGAITAVTQVGGNFQVAYSGTPAGFVSAVAYEVVHAKPGFEIVVVGTANGTGSGYIQFPGTIPADINVGDSLCLQDTANYPTNVPADVYLGLFADWLALRFSEIRGDGDQMERCAAVFKRTEKLGRSAYLGKRDRLGHRKISSASSRAWGRRPLYWVK